MFANLTIIVLASFLQISYGLSFIIYAFCAARNLKNG